MAPGEMPPDAGRPGGGRKNSQRGRGDELSRKLAPQPRARNPFLAWIVLLFLAIVAYQLYVQGRPQAVDVSYTQVMAEIEAGNIRSADL
ncbi:MAG: hypothetical protein FJZ88_10345, partial [Chloroflexi bacterium]|nr:hypothetical protein [Chloroflexota bacterium]